MEKAGILPKLRLATKKSSGGITSTGIQHVKLISDRIFMGKDKNTGKPREMMEYVVEHNGKRKSYQTKLKNDEGGLSYLVQRMAEFEEGEEITMEMKKIGIKNYVEVNGDTRSASAEMESEDEEDVDYLEEANPADIPFNLS